MGEKGEMRVEVNISVAEENAEKFGTKVEVKNINSFRAAGKAIEYETKRHIELLESGEKVVQETRGWDENKGKTFSQRSKENAHDYRYFPEPDLPKLIISEIPEFSLDNLKKSLPELPSELRQRFSDNFKLKSLDIETYINNVEASKFFQSVTEELKEVGEAIQTASNYITSDLLGFSKNVNLDFHIGKITPSSFAALIKMIKNTGKFDVGVGDNDWVNGILEENKIPVVRVGFYDRKKLEGTEIRKLMKGNKKKWEDRVPSYLVSQLTK
jgi:aspartyl-tRNA(Asn)/glutamyl-tRNA(Gln) amidotransferase subunit B